MHLQRKSRNLWAIFHLTTAAPQQIYPSSFCYSVIMASSSGSAHSADMIRLLSECLSPHTETPHTPTTHHALFSSLFQSPQKCPTQCWFSSLESPDADNLLVPGHQVDRAIAEVTPFPLFEDQTFHWPFTADTHF